MSENVLKLHGEIIPPGEQTIVTYTTGTLPSGHAISSILHIFRSNRPGPCLLLLAGMHGDEVNGIEILRSGLTSGMFNDIEAGTVIVAPLINLFGFIHFSRDVPDGKDINRSFPGTVGGSLAARLAYVIRKEWLPVADYIVDFHTGGASRFNHPQVRCDFEDRLSYEMGKAFASPFLIHKPVIAKSLREAATKMKKPVIVYEAGESIRYDHNAIACGHNGIKNIMHALRIKQNNRVSNTTSIECVSSRWIRATSAGMFLWQKPCSVQVQKGELLGEIHDPHGRERYPVISQQAGYIIGVNNAAVVSLGEALFHIGFTE